MKNLLKFLKTIKIAKFSAIIFLIYFGWLILGMFRYQIAAGGNNIYEFDRLKRTTYWKVVDPEESLTSQYGGWQKLR